MNHSRSALLIALTFIAFFLTDCNNNSVVRQIIGNDNPGNRIGTGCTQDRHDFILILSPPDPPKVPLLDHQVSFTYDDGPGPWTRDIAQYLADRRIPATFFVNGCRIQGRTGCQAPFYDSSILEDLVAMGHRIGNHTETHAALWLPSTDIVGELTRTQELIDPWIKDGFYFVRPPNNCWTPEVEQIVRNDPNLRKLTGPFFYDSGGADWHCSQSDQNLDPAACALAYYRDMPTQKRGIIQFHDRNPNDPWSDYALRVTKCLVEGIGSLGCPDPRENPLIGENAFISVGGPPTSSDERQLFASFQYVPLDAIPGVTSGQFANGSFVPAGYVQTELGDSEGWDSLPSRYETIRIGDVNGDGIGDVCARHSDGVVCALGLGNGSFKSFSLWSSALSDLMGYDATEYGSTFQLADVNGDMMADACARGSAGVFCLLSNGSMFTTGLGSSEFSDALGWRTSRSYYGSIRFADINGDGRADVCGRGMYGIICALSTSTGFGQPSTWLYEYTDADGWLPDEYGSTIQLGDINGDGLTDICGRGVDGIYCATSQGDAFSHAHLWIDWQFTNGKGWAASPSLFGSIRLADIDGDGLADICGRDRNGVVCAVAQVGQSVFFIRVI